MGNLDPTAVAQGFATISTGDAAFPIVGIVIATLFALYLFFRGAKAIIRLFRV